MPAKLVSAASVGLPLHHFWYSSEQHLASWQFPQKHCLGQPTCSYLVSRLKCGISEHTVSCRCVYKAFVWISATTGACATTTLAAYASQRCYIIRNRHNKAKISCSNLPEALNTITSEAQAHDTKMFHLQKLQLCCICTFSATQADPK